MSESNRKPAQSIEGYEVTVLPPFTREQAVKDNPYLAFTGGLGTKPSRPLGHMTVDQTNSIDPATGKPVRERRAEADVSLGARMSGVPGDIHLSKSGR